MSASIPQLTVHIWQKMLSVSDLILFLLQVIIFCPWREAEAFRVSLLITLACIRIRVPYCGHRESCISSQPRCHPCLKPWRVLEKQRHDRSDRSTNQRGMWRFSTSVNRCRKDSGKRIRTWYDKNWQGYHYYVRLNMGRIHRRETIGKEIGHANHATYMPFVSLRLWVFLLYNFCT